MFFSKGAQDFELLKQVPKCLMLLTSNKAVFCKTEIEIEPEARVYSSPKSSWKNKVFNIEIKKHK